MKGNDNKKKGVILNMGNKKRNQIPDEDLSKWLQPFSAWLEEQEGQEKAEAKEDKSMKENTPDVQDSMLSPSDENDFEM